MTKRAFVLRTIVLILAVVAHLFASESSGFAQIGTSGSFVGTVRDSSGGVLPGAEITATNVATGIARSGTADGSGRFVVAPLAPGEYRVEGSLQGFQSDVHEGIVLIVGKTQEVNFTLGVGDVEQAVTVIGGAPLVETSSSTVSTLVNGDTIRALPLNGRSVDQLITLSPGTVNFDQRTTTSTRGTASQFSIAGVRPSTMRLAVDGVEYAGSNMANSLVSTASGKVLGVEAIQEFAVVASAADASFGKKSGGQVSIVTRSGSNAFHGTALEFLRSGKLDARNFFDQEKPKLNRNNYGFALGGPIVRNRTFFFGNYEKLRERRGITDVVVVPTAAARQGIFPNGRVVAVNPASVPLLDMYPLPNGRDFGDGTAMLTLPLTLAVDDAFGLVRLDHNFQGADALFLRYMIQEGVLIDPTGGLGEFADRPEIGTQLGTLGYTKILTPRLVNQATLGLNQSRLYLDIVPINGFEPPQALYLVPGETSPGAVGVAVSGGGGGSATNPFPNLGGGVTVGAQQRLMARRTWEFADQLSYTTSRHDLRGGLDFQLIHADEYQQAQKLGFLQFPSLQALVEGKPNRLNAPLPGSDANRNWKQTYVGVYFQDNFRVLSRVTLNLGVRWERLSNPTEARDRIGRWVPVGSELTGVYPDAPTVQVSNVFAKVSGNFAPRVGFAWDVFGNGRTSVRSGAGVFYDQLENDYRRSLGAAPPFSLTAVITNPPFPNPGQALATATLGTVPPVGLDETPNVPRMIQYNVRLEQQLDRSTVVSVAYMGNRGQHLNRSTNPQVPPPFLNADGRWQVPQQVVNPKVSAQAQFYVFDGTSSYNSLQVDLERRLSQGFRFKVAFTLAKAVDDSVDPNQAFSGIASNMLVATDHSWARGPAPYDVRRRFSTSWTYDLPTGDHGGALGAVVDGWQWSGVFQCQDGFPFSVFVGGSRSFPGDARRVDDADVVTGRSSDSIIRGGPNQYFDPSAFERQPVGILGNTPVGFLTGPGLALFDSSLMKTFHTSGKTSLEFRIDVFNLLNRANFGLPDNTIFETSGLRRGAAGQIRKTATNAREFQFGLKFRF